MNGSGTSECLNYSIAISIAIFTIFGNLLIIMASLRSRELRKKETSIILGLAFADGLTGVAGLSLNVNRIVLIYENRLHNQASVWDCLSFTAVFVPFSIQFQGWMMVAANADRLFAVVDPLRHLGMPKCYPFLVGGIVLFYNIFVVALGLGLGLESAASEEKIYTLQCLPFWLFPKIYNAYLIFCRAFTGYLSTILYVLTFYFYRKKNIDSLAQLASADQKRSLEKQRELTRVFGVVSLCTMLFHNLPFTFLMFVIAFTKLEPAMFSQMVTYLIMISTVNTACNIVIYIWRFPDVRKAVVALFCCKKVIVAPISNVGGSGLRLGPNWKTRPAISQRANVPLAVVSV